MSRIKGAFENKKAFIGFVTGGDPTLDKSLEFILSMVEAGADLIEIGIPFSDPIAEGPVIQEANIRALAVNTDTESIFRLVTMVREKSEVPLVLLTYVNPVFKYGYERFFARCKEAGVDGIIMPDLPYEEKGELADIAEVHGIDVISLIAPTSNARIQMIAKEAKGFLYVVSSMGVTGVRQEISVNLDEILPQIRAVSDIPAAVGFGVSTPEQAERIAATADGVIVGSAIVRIIEKYGMDAAKPLYDYVKSMKDAISRA